MAESEIAKSAVKIIKGLDKLIQEAKKFKEEVQEIVDKDKQTPD